MQSEEDIAQVISTLAPSSGLPEQSVRVLWVGIARATRPAEGPSTVYAELASKHHAVQVTVVDLGQYSAEHSSSCMFLTCAAALAERRLCGYADAELPGLLGETLGSAGLDQAAQLSTIEELIGEHLSDRKGTLGKMADALRHAACELLHHDSDFYKPFFHPVRGDLADMDHEVAYALWLADLRGSEEGDELVILALARLCGIAVQPVQKSGYRVPLMDPTSAADSEAISFWGNNDRHWVWLRKIDSQKIDDSSSEQRKRDAFSF